jgi:hypothetical protein
MSSSSCNQSGYMIKATQTNQRKKIDHLLAVMRNLQPAGSNAFWKNLEKIPRHVELLELLE